MSALSEFDDVVEVERYELTEESRYHFEFDRREFLKVFSGGIALIIPLSRMFGPVSYTHLTLPTIYSV